MPRTLADIKAAFRWDADAQRWRNAAGRFVSESKLKRELLKFAKSAGQEIKDLAGQMSRGEIEIGEWQEAMALRVKNIHLALEAAAKGGFHNLTQADYGAIGNRLRRQYHYLNNFARAVEQGKQSAAQIVARAALYANAGGGVYENARRENAGRVFLEERRVLGAAEHCDVCIEQAALKWQPTGTLLPLGQSPCRANCRCSYKFRKRHDA